MINASREIKALLGYIFAWSGAFWIVYWVALHSDNKWVYGVISGWWCALYVSHILQLRLAIALYAVIVHFFYQVFLTMFDFHPSYHDFNYQFDEIYLMYILLLSLAFSSPIIIDYLIRKYMSKSS